MASNPERGSAEEEFPPAIRAAFDAYASPKPDAAFDARFWRELDARKNRYRGFSGFCRRVVEVEIEGVAVWRLGVSTFSGGAFCLLALGAALQVAAPHTAPPLPVPRLLDPPPTRMYAFAWSRRALENGVWPDEKPLAPGHRATSKSKDFSCTPLNAPWA